MSIVDKTAWVKYTELNDGCGRFELQPLEKGMGITIGNSLRRVLHSSLPGFGIRKVKIDGVQHEFSTVPNVVEDVLDIIANLKQVIFASNIKESKTFTIEGKSKSILTAKDIKLDGETTIINPEVHIAELTGNAKLKIELTVEAGNGYVAAEDIDEPGVINIDTSFSPIVKVNHTVENIRVGKDMGYDSLTLDVYTNGSITAESAVSLAAQHLISRYQLFATINEQPEPIQEDTESPVANDLKEAAMNLTIDDLELSARSSNCLKRAGIESVSELIEMDMPDLINIKNFGKKSAEEINEKLSQYSLSLKGSLEELVK